MKTQIKIMNSEKRKTIVYFHHEKESILEGMRNRWRRPKDFYRTILPKVCKKLGIPLNSKFKWSQKAGCSCGCSPGFISQVDCWREIFVTLKEEVREVA